jgi:hypothetical protein
LPRNRTFVTKSCGNSEASTLHPNAAGMNKMIVNHLSKLFVTNDASTMVREMEVTPREKSLSSFTSTLDPKP